MVDNILTVKHQQRHDTEANWTSKDPVLLDGELGFVDETQKFKVGNGKLKWSELDYHNALTDADLLKLNTIDGTADKDKEVKSASAIKDFNNPDKYLEFTTNTGLLKPKSDLRLLGANKNDLSKVQFYAMGSLEIGWDSITNKPDLYSQEQVDEKVSNVILFQSTEPTSQTVGGVWCKTTNLT